MTAQDLCHDTFYEACKSIGSFNGHSTLSTWVFSIATNLLKKYYRKNKYQQGLMQKLAAIPETEIHSLEELAEIHEDTRILLHHISKLDDASREIVLLRIYGELSFAEIGVLIGKSENYARVTFYRSILIAVLLAGVPNFIWNCLLYSSVNFMQKAFQKLFSSHSHP